MHQAMLGARVGQELWPCCWDLTHLSSWTEVSVTSSFGSSISATISCTVCLEGMCALFFVVVEKPICKLEWNL